MMPNRLIAIALIVSTALFASESTIAQQATPSTAAQQQKPPPLPVPPPAEAPQAKPVPPSQPQIKTARRDDMPTIQRVLHVDMSGGELLELPRPAASVFIADPAIADVQAPAGASIIVFGKKPGATTLFALDDNGKAIAKVQVVVSYGLAELQNLVRQEVPAGTVSVSSTPTGIILSGQVPTADDAEKARAAAARYVGDKQELINQVQVSGPMQVNLRVRVAEVQRQITKQLGFNWETVVSPGAFSFGLATGRNAFLAGGQKLSPTNFDIDNVLARAQPLTQGAPLPGSLFGNFNSKRATVNTLIDALADEGLITILAEPNLTAVSGQTASFLAGGEFPIPVAQNNSSNGITITIEFKQFGVSLDFVPTVMGSDHISLKVRPEVSQLSSQGAITLSQITVPALSVRRAETTVELGSGDSFAIAGLIQNNTAMDLNKYPGLGDLPILGPLFRSTNFQRNESELVIIVTPYLVRPANAQALKLPTDGLAPASDLERIFLGRLNRNSGEAGAVNPIGVGGARLRGDSGFIIN
jgi:pilus assembly protein CpaC